MFVWLYFLKYVLKFLNNFGDVTLLAQGSGRDDNKTKDNDNNADDQTCLNKELMLFPSMTSPGLLPPTG